MFVPNGNFMHQAHKQFSLFTTDFTHRVHILYSNRTITIDVGDNDVNLLVDDFDMNYGTINVIGNGDFTHRVHILF